jgi:hypothetical protein
MLHPLGINIWIAEGRVVSFFGFPYPTRAAIVRLDNGDLFIWSPIALTASLKEQVDNLGPVRHLVSPNKLHWLFLADWKAAYPAAKLYASPGLAKKRPELKFDAGLGDAPVSAWAAEIDQVEVAGSFALTEIVFFHRTSSTALFTDLIQNFRRDWFKGWKGCLARLDGITMPASSAPREWRLSFLNRTKAKAALDRILAWHPRQVVMAHGEIVHENGTIFIRNSFRWLKRN